MHIFVSWSKDTSRAAALYLREFIKEFFKSKTLDIYVSSDRIVAGENWFDNIKDAISKSSLCILILTDDNEFSRWIYFEAGAIAFNTKATNIIPLLLSSKQLDPGSPLRAYQNISNNREGIKKLLLDIKRVGNLKGVTADEFNGRFDSLYPKLEGEFNSILEKARSISRTDTVSFQDIFPKDVLSVEAGKVFVGAPMAGMGGDIKYGAHRANVIDVIEAMEICCDDVNVYWAGRTIKKVDEFHGEMSALTIDLRQLKSSAVCVFIYMESVVTSVIVEIGYAIALNKRTIIFCRSKSDLPYMLRHSNDQISNLSIHECRDFADVIKMLERDGNAILGAR